MRGTTSVEKNFDRVARNKNDKGREAMLGRSGKYYCGG